MNPKTCPTCHAPIPENAPGGLCPACVLRGAGEEPAPSPGTPPLEEIAAAFPQWEVLGLIGRGGMGFVYRVRQPGLDRSVALKILDPALGRDPAFAERFAREARTLGKLQHPNIVSVFEHGEAGGFFYLVMELVDGVNLRQAMQAGRFTPEQALAIVPGICDALQAAHAQGVWHRDIKPENILLDKEGRVKIADFGIARLVGDPQRDFTLTRTGHALGSAAYMAPEQHEKPHDVDHRADIYSLGVVIYEMLTGELPLGRFPLPSQRAQVGKRIDEIVLRTLEKERELRQQSATEVKTEVEGVGNGIRPKAIPQDSAGRMSRWALAVFVVGALGVPVLNAFLGGSEVMVFATAAWLVALALGLLGWKDRIGKFVVIVTVGIGVIGAGLAGLKLRPWGESEAGNGNAKQEVPPTILDKREPRPKVAPPPQPPSGLSPKVQSPAESAIRIDDVFLAMNAAANTASFEEFNKHMAKSGHAGGALRLPMEVYMERFAGTTGKKSVSSNPDREDEIHLEVMFQRPNGKAERHGSFRFRVEDGHWRYVFDGFVEHRVFSRIEIAPPNSISKDLLNKSIWGPCSVIPVQGSDSLFDIVATCLNPEEAIAWANYFAKNAEAFLKDRGLDVSVRTVTAAKRPEEIPHVFQPAEEVAPKQWRVLEETPKGRREIGVFAGKLGSELTEGGNYQALFFHVGGHPLLMIVTQELENYEAGRYDDKITGQFNWRTFQVEDANQITFDQQVRDLTLGRVFYEQADGSFRQIARRPQRILSGDALEKFIEGLPAE